MMPLEILKAIELIDSKIAGLQRVRQTLLEEFGEKQAQTDSQAQSSFFDESRHRHHLFTRKDAIVQLLQKEGPLSRSEILDKSGIPTGTVATILNDKRRFQSKGGKWHYIEEREKGLTDSK